MAWPRCSSVKEATSTASAPTDAGQQPPPGLWGNGLRPSGGDPPAARGVSSAGARPAATALGRRRAHAATSRA
jgi:hypothetical protein